VNEREALPTYTRQLLDHLIASGMKPSRAKT
jgi:hypothetical protein